jgi:hypothetical protein
MDALSHLSLALLHSGAPTLAAVVVLGIVVKCVLPIQFYRNTPAQQLYLSIGLPDPQRPLPVKTTRRTKRPTPRL